MTSQLPGNLAEIFPLRLRLRKQFRFFRSGDQTVGERVDDGQRFSVRNWQYEMFLRFDGKRTFEQAAKEAYQVVGGGFTAVGLLNFYRWLYQENLVLCECDSIFELVVEEENTKSDLSILKPSVKPEDVASPAIIRKKEPISYRFGKLVEAVTPDKPWQKTALKASAIVIFGLAVIRLAFVAAPVLEPPMNRLYAGIDSYFRTAPAPEATTTKSETVTPPATPDSREIKLAGRAEPAPVPQPETPQKVEVSVDPIPIPEAEKIGWEKIEELRRRMSECRIRRDEFYIQNNEVGYREEVAKMTELAREIGEIEAKL